MFLGVVLVLLTAYVGWNVMTGRETLAGSHHPAILAFAISFFVLLGIFSVVAGYKLTRRSSWKPLLLQLVPAFVVAFFAWISAVG